MSMNSFQLKGGGWYVTDYANKKTDAPPKAATPAAGDNADKKAASKAADPAPAAAPAKEAAAPASKA
jgi:hypothetical protein